MSNSERIRGADSPEPLDRIIEEQVRIRTQELTEKIERLEHMGAIAKIGSWELDLSTLKLFWSLETCRIHEVDPPIAPDLETAIQFYAPEARPLIQAAVQAAMDYGTPWDFELPMITAKGRAIWARAQGSAIMKAGKVIKLHGAFQDVTVRKQAEATLNEERERTKTYLDVIETIIVALDAEGRIASINRKGCLIFGCSESDLMGVQWFEKCLPQPHGIDIVYPFFLRLMAGELEGTEYQENPIITHQGELREIAWHNAILRDKTGKIVGTLSSGEDITERKKAEAALRESEAKLRTLFETMSEGVALNEIIYNADGEMVDYRILDVNKAFYATADFTDIQVVGNVATKLYDMTVDEIKEFWEAHRNRKQVQHREIRSPVSEKWFFVSTSPFINNRFVTSFFDITERKKAEEALRLATERLSLATRAGGVGVWDWDLVTNVLTWDGQMFSLYGVSRNQFMGVYEAWKACLHPEDALAAHQEIYKAIRGEKEFDTEFRIVRPDGTARNIRALGSVKRDDLGQAIRMVGTNWDITERRQAEESIQSSLREKVALLNEVHHRVKNNLQVITSLLRLEASRSLQSGTKAVLMDMQGRIRAMALLHESLYRSGVFASVDLGAYIKQIATQAFRTLAPQNNSIRLELNLTSVNIGMDQATPCGLLVNELVSNSFKHGFPEGFRGEVKIELQPVANSATLRLRVMDTGIGLPENFMERRDQSLGLQLVSDLAAQIGGELKMGDGPGADFCITFKPDNQNALGIAK